MQSNIKTDLTTTNEQAKKTGIRIMEIIIDEQLYERICEIAKQNKRPLMHVIHFALADYADSRTPL